MGRRAGKSKLAALDECVELAPTAEVIYCAQFALRSLEFCAKVLHQKVLSRNQKIALEALHEQLGTIASDIRQIYEE